MPYFPPPIHVQHCDCMVDKSRETYKDSEYDSVGFEKLSKFYRELHDQCEEEMGMGKEPVKVDPTSI